MRLFEELQVYQKMDKEAKETKKFYENEKKQLEIDIFHLDKQIVELRLKLRSTEDDAALMKEQLFELKQEQLKNARDDEKEHLQLKDVLIRQKKYKLQLQN